MMLEYNRWRQNHFIILLLIYLWWRKMSLKDSETWNIWALREVSQISRKTIAKYSTEDLRPVFFAIVSAVVFKKPIEALRKFWKPEIELAFSLWYPTLCVVYKVVSQSKLNLFNTVSMIYLFHWINNNTDNNTSTKIYLHWIC